MRGMGQEPMGKPKRTYNQRYCIQETTSWVVLVIPTLHLFTAFLQHPSLEYVLRDRQIEKVASAANASPDGGRQYRNNNLITSPAFIGGYSSVRCTQPNLTRHWGRLPHTCKGVMNGTNAVLDLIVQVITRNDRLSQVE